MTDAAPEPDTGDHIDPEADDPTPDPVTDPEDPNWVEPYRDATPAADPGEG